MTHRTSKILSFLILLAGLSIGYTLTATGQEPPPEAPGATAAPEDRDALFGVSIVHDPAHTIETVVNGAKLVQQLRELKELLDRAERHLEKLERLPFVDPENFTGAFLENMLYELGSATDWSVHVEEIEEILDEHFIGSRAKEFFENPDAYPPNGMTGQEYHLERLDEMRTGTLRRMAILQEHTQQLSRERQGLAAMRRGLDGATGSSQHLEHIATVVHQMADAQSVDRQILLLWVSQGLLKDLDDLSSRAEAFSLYSEAIKSAIKDEMPLHEGGIWVV